MSRAREGGCGGVTERHRQLKEQDQRRGATWSAERGASTHATPSRRGEQQGASQAPQRGFIFGCLREPASLLVGAPQLY